MTLVLMRPLFRYSETRGAYVLRAVGRHVGPVLRRRSLPSPEPPAEPAPAADQQTAP